MAAVAFVSGCGGSDNASVAAFDAKTGKQLWRTPLGAVVVDDPKVFGDLVVVSVTPPAKGRCNFGAPYRVAMEWRTGRVLKGANISPSAEDSNREVGGGITVESEPGRVRALDRKGEEVWSRSVPGTHSFQIAVVRDRVFASFGGINPLGGDCFGGD
jgi:outer membrane protein assembly factor BamB